jgi:hypothetical protein
MNEVNRWLGEDAPCWVCAVVDGTVKAFAAKRAFAADGVMAELCGGPSRAVALVCI